MKIENERQLKTALDFLSFVKRHNDRVEADGSTYDLLVRQANLLKEQATTIEKQRAVIDQLESQIKEKDAEISDLEREVRVGRDLLTISKVVKQC